MAAELWTSQGLAGARQAGDLDAAATAANNLAFSVLTPQSRFDEARQVLGEAIDLDAGYQSLNAASNLGIVEFENANHEAARELFAKVLDEEGPVEEAHYYLGIIAEAACDLPTARQHWQRAAAGDDPDYEQAAKQALSRTRKRR